MKNFIKRVFSITRDNLGRKTITLLGFTKVLNPLEFEIKQVRTFLELSTDITKLPKATGILRLLQKADTVMLKEITDICDKNGLTYWINYGTLLGAVRHKGFIPWDDDLDICMPRDDWEKLINILDELFKGTNYCYIVSDCLRIFYKNTPIQLDIFPLDYYYKHIETEEEEAELFKKVAEAKKKIVYKKIKSDIHPLRLKNSYEEVKKLRDEIVMENKLPQKPASLFRAVETQVGHLSYYKYDWIFPLQKIEFEGNLYYAPNKIETVLFENFGDYMLYPSSITKRHSDIKNRFTTKSLSIMQDYINGVRL